MRQSAVRVRLRLACSSRGAGNVAKVSATPGCTRSVGNFQVCHFAPYVVWRSQRAVLQVSDDPALYLVDTPGVMVPRVTNVEAGMNLVLTGSQWAVRACARSQRCVHELACATTARTGCLMDKVVGEVAAADYMLFKLNSMGDFRYVKVRTCHLACASGSPGLSLTERPRWQHFRLNRPVDDVYQVRALR